MAGIFTRKAITDILNSEADVTEKTAQIMALNGRNLEDGYIAKHQAETEKTEAVNAAVAEAKKLPPDIKGSDEYKALQSQYDAYKAKQDARYTDDYKGVKPKFYDAVYDAIDRKEGAKPLADQIKTLRETYAEYFDDDAQQPKHPQFGGGSSGGMPEGNGKQSFMSAWGFVPKKE